LNIPKYINIAIILKINPTNLYQSKFSLNPSFTQGKRKYIHTKKLLKFSMIFLAIAPLYLTIEILKDVNPAIRNIKTIININIVILDPICSKAKIIFSTRHSLSPPFVQNISLYFEEVSFSHLM
jgi:hypothetical protein